MRERVMTNSRINACAFSVSRYHPTMSEFCQLPLRRRIAWRLRAWADRIDPGLSYHMAGQVPSGLGDEALFDALCFGAAAMQTYMADQQSDQQSDRRSERRAE